MADSSRFGFPRSSVWSRTGGVLLASVLALTAVPGAGAAAPAGEEGKAEITVPTSGVSKPGGVEVRAKVGRVAFMPKRRDLEKAIRAAYQRLEKYASAANHPLELRLSGFETLDQSQFDEVQWLDVADMPGGAVIDATPEANTDALGVRSARYRMKWNTHSEEEWLQTEDGRAMVGMTVAEILEKLAAQSPDYQGLQALTRYEVEASLDGRTRKYRAAALWGASGTPGYARMILLDRIVQGVEEAAVERLPTPVEAALQAPPRERRANAKSSAQCEPSSSTISRGKSLSGNNNHFSGYHFSDAYFVAECSCSWDCRSECDARLSIANCSDTGTPSTSCHKMASSINASAGFKSDGHLEGASCAAGLGCVQKACLFCACGLSVEVSIVGDLISFSYSGGPDWSGNLEFSAQCPRCQEVCDGDGQIGGGEYMTVFGEGEETIASTCGSGGGATGGGGTGGGGAMGAEKTCVDVKDGETGAKLGECCGYNNTEIINCAKSYLN
jgi:hypothetical protein